MSHYHTGGTDGHWSGGREFVGFALPDMCATIDNAMHFRLTVMEAPMNPVLFFLVLLFPASVASAQTAAAQTDPALATPKIRNSLTPHEVKERMSSVYEGSKPLAQVRSLWQSGRHASAEKEFKKVLSGQLEPELRKQVNFLLARMLFDAKEYQRAAPIFEQAAQDLPDLKDWSLYYTGLCRYRAGELGPAVQAFSGIRARFARSAAVMEMTCEAAYRLGDLDRFSACMAGFAARGRTPALLLLLDAERLMASGKYADAVVVLKDIQLQHPTSDASDEAAGLARKLKKNGLAKNVKLSSRELLQRAERLYSKYHYSSALKIAEALIKKSKKGSEMWCRSLGLTARSWARRREETKSQPFFEKFVEKCDPYLTPETLFRGVDAARKAGKRNNARDWADLLVARFPESTLGDDSLLYVARMQAARKNVGEVERLVQQILAQYPLGDMAAEAAWLLVFSQYRNGKLSKAMKTAEHYQELLPERQNYKTNGRLLYWMGRIHQRLGNSDKARTLFELTLEKYPFFWYALLSYQRLEQSKKGRGRRALKHAREASKALLPGPEEVLGELSDWQVDLDAALLLLSMELKREARDELKFALGNAKGEMDTGRHLLTAYLYDRAGRYDYAHQILRRKVEEFQYSYPTKDDDRWWKVAYPSVYEKLIRESSQDEDIPFSVIIAIMREESGFDPRIESYAHAIGLMQLLQKTASWVAGKQMSRRRLRIPKYNIPLGVKYLRYLLDKFNHPAMMAAGYNSGPGGVYKTLKNTQGREIDEFVEFIPYDQTRRYTKRVLATAWTYQVLYGDKDGVVPFPLKYPKQKPKR